MNGQPVNAIKMLKKREIEPAPNGAETKTNKQQRIEWYRIESNETKPNQTQPPSQINARKWHQTTWVWWGVCFCIEELERFSRSILISHTAEYPAEILV